MCHLLSVKPLTVAIFYFVLLSGLFEAFIVVFSVLLCFYFNRIR